jgi:hypothetical protein
VSTAQKSGGPGKSRRRLSLLVHYFKIILRRLSPSSPISFIPRDRKVKDKVSFAGLLSVLTMYWENCLTLAVVKLIFWSFVYILNSGEYPELFSLCPQNPHL